MLSLSLLKHIRFKKEQFWSRTENRSTIGGGVIRYILECKKLLLSLLYICQRLFSSFSHSHTHSFSFSLSLSQNNETTTKRNETERGREKRTIKLKLALEKKKKFRDRECFCIYILPTYLQVQVSLHPIMDGLTHYTTMVSENSVLCVFSLGPPTTDSDLNAPPPHRQSVIFEWPWYSMTLVRSQHHLLIRSCQ